MVSGFLFLWGNLNFGFEILIGIVLVLVVVPHINRIGYFVSNPFF